jgi:hypothetical protein
LSVVSIDLFDNKDDSKIVANISNTDGYRMNICITRDEQKDFRASVNFFFKESEIQHTSIDDNIVSELICSYNRYLLELLLSKQGSDEERHPNVTGGKDSALEPLSDLYQDIQIENNIYTLDGINNKVIARTKIELDADIMTILPTYKLDRKVAIFLRIHSCNIYLANQLLSYRIKKFCHNIRMINNLARIGTASIPFFPYLSPEISKNILNIGTSPQDIYVILTPIISYLLWRFAPKILWRFAPKILWRFAPKIVGRLIKYKIFPNFRL